MNEIKIRKTIQEAGKELYERLGITSKSLQWLAGELMIGNEELIRRLQCEGHGFTMGAEHIFKHGFTHNQIEFLTTIEKELKWYKERTSNLEDQISFYEE